MQLQPRLGVGEMDLQPIRRIGAFHRPLLIMSGAEDMHTTQAETLRLLAFLGAHVPHRTIDAAD